MNSSRWRRVLVAGWLLFAVSFLLPALSGIPDRHRITVPPPPPPLPSAASSIMPEAGAVSGSAGSLMAQRTNLTPGWEAFLYALFGWGGILGITSALTNLLMVATAFHGKWSARERWPVIVLAAAAVFNLGYWLWWVADDGGSTLEIGYYVWVASFACATVAFRLRAQKGTIPTSE
ncbi:MAG: hypothetical protein OXR82_00470 [Gammaproteobacteria bacterium]|nr:hypothetical protein [Gammaproteobacteria bacterium]MDE0256845.1 hypothetical protein [Gammaproteobacteria bacterium]